jgi:hypothetical protein
MKALASILLVASCTADAGDDYPIRPAGTPAISSGTATGRVCVVTDPRNLTTCAPGAGGGLNVTLGGASTTTTGDGSFTVPTQPATTNPMVTVTGPGVVPTQMALSPAMSVLRADLFSQMMAANGIPLSTGSGSILGRVTRGGLPASGITVSSTPPSAFGPLFDGGAPTAFTLDATGQRGIVWLPGVALGPTQLTFRDIATSGETIVGGVRVIDGGVTIMDVVLP